MYIYTHIYTLYIYIYYIYIYIYIIMLILLTFLDCLSTFGLSIMVKLHKSDIKESELNLKIKQSYRRTISLTVT